MTGVRVERLQAIGEEDARAESCTGHDPRAHFMHLWDSINANRAPWSSNPLVWVVEFRRAA